MSTVNLFFYKKHARRRFDPKVRIITDKGYLSWYTLNISKSENSFSSNLQYFL